MHFGTQYSRDLVKILKECGVVYAEFVVNFVTLHKRAGEKKECLWVS